MQNEVEQGRMNVGRGMEGMGRRGGAWRPSRATRAPNTISMGGDSEKTRWNSGMACGQRKPGEGMPEKSVKRECRNRSARKGGRLSAPQRAAEAAAQKEGTPEGSGGVGGGAP